MQYDMQAEGQNGVSVPTIIGANNWSSEVSPVLLVTAVTPLPPHYSVTALDCQGAGTGAGVIGRSDNAGVIGEGSGWGVLGRSVGGVNAAGVRGQCFQGSGVYGISSANAGAGVQGQNEAGPGVFGWSTGDNGVVGASTGPAVTGNGVWGISESSSGVLGMSAEYAGVTGVGKQAGVQGTADDYGVFGISPSGIGVYGRTTDGIAVHGFASQTPPNPFTPPFAGRFDGNVFVLGAVTATVKNAIVPHPDGSTRLLTCLECPEGWFEDFGKGRLARGIAQVTIDPNFAAIVDAEKYHVFLTPYGDCNGLYVAGQTATGFAVREHKGGTSDVEFSYRLVAKRKDVKDERLPKITLPQRPPEPRLQPLPDASRFRRKLDVAPATP